MRVNSVLHSAASAFHSFVTTLPHNGAPRGQGVGRVPACAVGASAVVRLGGRCEDSDDVPAGSGWR